MKLSQNIIYGIHVHGHSFVNTTIFIPAHFFVWTITFMIKFIKFDDISSFFYKLTWYWVDRKIENSVFDFVLCLHFSIRLLSSVNFTGTYMSELMRVQPKVTKEGEEDVHTSQFLG